MLYSTILDQKLNLILQLAIQQDGRLHTARTATCRADIGHILHSHGTHPLASDLHKSEFGKGQNRMLGLIASHKLMHLLIKQLTVLRLMQINPLDIDEIVLAMSSVKQVFVVEEVAGNCGIKEQLAYQLSHIDPQYFVDGIDLGTRYIQHGSVNKLYDYYGLSAEKLAWSIKEVHYSEE